jgi:hypothetical protein
MKTDYGNNINVEDNSSINFSSMKRTKHENGIKAITIFHKPTHKAHFDQRYQEAQSPNKIKLPVRFPDLKRISKIKESVIGSRNKVRNLNPSLNINLAYRL